MNIVSPLVLRLVESTLWCVALLCVGAFVITQIHSASAQSAALSRLESAWDIELPGQPDQSLWSAGRIARHKQALSAISEFSALAILSVPAVDIRVAVFDGTSTAVLNAGVGRVPGTAEVGKAGNLALAGHRDGFFRGLKNIAIGDRIRIQHATGNEHYTVTDISIVEPDDVSVLAPTQTPTVTLITCYPFYFLGNAPQRYIVRAERNADEQIF